MSTKPVIDRPDVSAPIAEDRSRRQLGLFATRCDQIAARVVAGEMAFIEAVDMVYSAAIWSGLADLVGDDQVQAIMAGAFMRTRRAAP